MNEMQDMLGRMTEHIERAIHLTQQWVKPPEQIPPRALSVIKDLVSGLHAGLTLITAEMAAAAQRGDINKTLELTNRVRGGLMQFGICAYAIGHTEGEPAPEYSVAEEGDEHQTDGLGE